MSDFYMLIGIPASGKTTYVKRLKENNPELVIVSSDAIREKLMGDAECQTGQENVFQQALMEIKEQLKLQKSVIFDATNIAYKHRKNILQQIARLAGKKIACVIATEYEKCLSKNAQRTRQVPESEIEKMLLNFQFPMFLEGFDEIKIIHLYESTHVLSEDIEKMEQADTQNVYHTQTIGKHSRFTKELWEESRPDLSKGYRAGALLHDIGKLYMMQQAGGPLEHYMGHGSVGAYYLVCMEQQVKQLYGLTEQEFFDLLFLVNFHMQPFIWEKAKQGESKVKTADKERFGEERIGILTEFTIYDRKRP